MRSCNPATPPNYDAWLALDEGERIQLAKAFHESHGEFGESLNLHAGMHGIIETQLAMDAPNAREALVRLQEQGLTRHDAIHAIGSVLMEHIYDIQTSVFSTAEEANNHYAESLKNFNVEDW